MIQKAGSLVKVMVKTNRHIDVGYLMRLKAAYRCTTILVNLTNEKVPGQGATWPSRPDASNWLRWYCLSISDGQL